jgi:hypothetical protein
MVMCCRLEVDEGLILLGGDFRAKDCAWSRVEILALINAFEMN